MAQKRRRRKSGVEIDLRKQNLSVEQALRELKNIMEDDMDRLKEKRYYIKPSLRRREYEKRKRANIRKYASKS